MTVRDPRVELIAVEEELRRLNERRLHLLALLSGPRVDPVAVVWAGGRRSEDASFNDLWEAVRFMQFQNAEGDCWVECVKVGGYVLTEDEADEIALEGSRG